MKRARPQGLGSVSKKEKAEDEIPKVASIESESTGEPGKLFYELPEDATALDQLRALFESATMFLDNTQKAKPVFNGVVHECLRLEAILDNENGPEEQEGDEKDLDSYLQVKKDADKIFGSEFYFIFGESLRTLAELEMGDEIEESSLEQVIGLLSASIDRFQLSKEKLNSNDTSASSTFVDDLSNGLIYSMASLFILIKDNDDKLRTDLKELINEETKDTISSAIFDSIEFFCTFCETAHETDFEIDNFDELCSRLESNLKLVAELVSDEKKLNLVKVDVPLRLAIIKSDEIDEAKAKTFLDDLDEILKDKEDVSIRFEALQLKASIKEILGLEEEAALIYEEADALQQSEEVETEEQDDN